MASIALWRSGLPVKKTNGMSISDARISRSKSRPSMSGITRSLTMASNVVKRALAIASRPPRAIVTWCPRFARTLSVARASADSSSTTRIDDAKPLLPAARSCSQTTSPMSAIVSRWRSALKSDRRAYRAASNARGCECATYEQAEPSGPQTWRWRVQPKAYT